MLFARTNAPGLFNAALTVNWFQHIPRQILPQWIRRLHRKLVPGSIVMIAVNHLTARARSRLFSRRRDPNLYAPRYTFDGRRIEIIDNVYSEPDLREIFRPYCRDFCFYCGVGHYWITYEPVKPKRATAPCRTARDQRDKSRSAVFN